jgi:hypothetical protein
MFAPRLKEPRSRQTAAPSRPSATLPLQQESSTSHRAVRHQPAWNFGEISVHGDPLPSGNMRGGEGPKGQALAWNQRGASAGSGSGSGATVAATPVAVRNGPHHTPIDEPDQVGMAIGITLTSSTGTDADMRSILDSEKVSDSKGHTGSCRSMPTIVSDPTNTSSFMPGFPIPDDQHGTGRALVINRADNHGGDGQFDFDQLDIFKANASGASQAIPHSGYTVRRTIKTGTGGSIVLRTEKFANACTVGSFSSEAGPSATQHCDVTVRAATAPPGRGTGSGSGSGGGSGSGSDH